MPTTYFTVPSHSVLLSEGSARLALLHNTQRDNGTRYLVDRCLVDRYLVDRYLMD